RASPSGFCAKSTICSGGSSETSSAPIQENDRRRLSSLPCDRARALIAGLRSRERLCDHRPMSSLRLLALPTIAALLLSLSACGRTESLILLDDAGTGGADWSYEDTAESGSDVSSADTSTSAEETDDWQTGEWGEEAPDTWG